MSSNARDLLGYVTALEIEVDRLRRTHEFLLQQMRSLLAPVQAACDPVRTNAQAKDLVTTVDDALESVGRLFRDLRQVPGCSPLRDQVVAIAARPMIEQVFRFQQRIQSAFEVELHLELEMESIEWFPGRLRHVLDCLLSNAIRYRDTVKGEARVTVGLCHAAETYVLRVSDNGLGFDWNEQVGLFELLHRIGPDRTGLGVGLAVTKFLIDQAGGGLVVSSAKGQGSSFVATLPRFDVNDFSSRLENRRPLEAWFTQLALQKPLQVRAAWKENDETILRLDPSAAKYVASSRGRRSRQCTVAAEATEPIVLLQEQPIYVRRRFRHILRDPLWIGPFRRAAPRSVGKNSRSPVDA